MDGDPIPTICVLGATGVGKGATLNSCFNTTQFGTSHKTASHTIRPELLQLPWRGTGPVMRGVDLCGFSDSEGRDTAFIEEMVAYLRNEVRYVHCFLLLLNSQEARLGLHLKDMLVALRSVFGVAVMRHVLIGFTRWDYSKRGRILRQRGHAASEEALGASVNAELRRAVAHDHDCACVFLDNTVHMCTDSDLDEMYSGDEKALVTAAFAQALDAVRSAAVGNPPFPTADLESVVAQRDVTKREEAARAHGGAVVEELEQEWARFCEALHEPQSLTEHLQASARAARGRLEGWLAQRCDSELEHVRSSVLHDFDAKVEAAIDGLLFRNGDRARSFNRQLRSRLAQEYSAFARGVASDEATSKHERFDAVRRKLDELVAAFVAEAEGGPLAWKPFGMLQEVLRVEQVAAREQIFREEIKAGAGGTLPEVTPRVTEPGALVCQLEMLVGRAAPRWLVTLSSEQN